MPEAAKELTGKQLAAKAKIAKDLENEVISGLKSAGISLWEVARSLHKFDEEAGWRHLGYETVSDWLAQPDINTTKATYYKMTRAYRELAVERKINFNKLKRLNISKIDIVLPKVVDGTVLTEKALEDVEAMGARDLREVYAPSPNGRAEITQGEQPVEEPGKVTIVDDDGAVLASDVDLQTGEVLDPSPDDGPGPVAPEDEPAAPPEDAQADIEEALASGASYARVHHSSLAAAKDAMVKVSTVSQTETDANDLAEAVQGLLKVWGDVSQGRVPKALVTAVAKVQEVFNSIYEQE